MADTREQALYMARLAEKFGRFDEMFELMVKAIQITQAQSRTLGELLAEPLSFEERNLFSVASKHVVSGRRDCLQSLLFIQEQELKQEQRNSNTLENIKKYIVKVTNELLSFCNKVIGILKSDLFDSVGGESKVFYLKMKGDYYRYLAEINVPQATDSAEEAYNQAQVAAERHLDVTHPIRLNLAINFSVFCYSILKDTERAKEMAKQAFKAASVKVKSSGEERYRDSLAIMQILDNHIRFWNQADGRRGQGSTQAGHV